MRARSRKPGGLPLASESAPRSTPCPSSLPSTGDGPPAIGCRWLLARSGYHPDTLRPCAGSVCWVG
ncbi:hypothetical protein [Ornithinimicrobium kibberense]|uniref:hypothetical protein n=1 Tax=Ornithinimicrobium kibberense TaxID=282060 RepID=UPI003621F7FB